MNATEEITRRLDVAEYVDEVKASLADLEADDREELVDGLEADLTERLLESDSIATPVEVFGPAASYADELRAAAGYPAPVAKARRGAEGRVRARWARARAFAQQLLATPTGQSVAQFFVAIRPLWWVARAWVALQVLDAARGTWQHEWLISWGGYGRGFVLLAAATVISVQIGRGAWWPSIDRSRWARYALLALNLFAIGAIPFIIALMPGQATAATDGRWAVDPGAYPDQGLRMDGPRVENIYAYDAHGKPLYGVQLFDQRGKPLSVEPTRDRWGYANRLSTYFWPWTEVDGESNVFPLAVSQRWIPEVRAFEDGSKLGIDAPLPAVPELPDQTRAEIAKLAKAGHEPTATRERGTSEREQPDRGKQNRTR